MKEKIIAIIIFAVLLNSCTNKSKSNNETAVDTIKNPTNTVVLSSEIEWEKLNPARGDKSPQAGTIWGDRKGEVATGFLAKFVDGFSSPPHIHNVTYRAVVLKGEIHNDGADAENMWMGKGSFWTQPKGEAHITSAKGEENIAYVEIDNGPYLVKPIDQAFDSGERPVNIDASNIVWLDSNKSNWIAPNSEAKISFLWKSNDLEGMFVKIPAGYKGTINSNGSIFRAIMIDGVLNYKMPKTNTEKSLDEGSSFSSTNKAVHTIENSTNKAVLIYIRTNGSIRIN